MFVPSFAKVGQIARAHTDTRTDTHHPDMKCIHLSFYGGRWVIKITGLGWPLVAQHAHMALTVSSKIFWLKICGRTDGI